MMIDDALDVSLTQKPRRRHCDLVHQQVSVLAVAEHVCVVAGVAGNHGDPVPVLDAIAVSRLDHLTMVDREGNYPEMAGLIDDAVSGEFLYGDSGMLPGKLLVRDPDFDVVRIGRLEMMHQFGGADRPDHIEWPLAVAEIRA